MAIASEFVQISPFERTEGKGAGDLFPKLRVLLIGLYSQRYPAIGETHGLSVIAASLEKAFQNSLEAISIIDLVAFGSEQLMPVLGRLETLEPNVVGISVPYGTYSKLMELAPHLRLLIEKGTCVIVGGSLPTYLSGRLLVELDPRVVVVVGEGEDAVVGAVRAWAGQLAWNAVPNLHITVNGSALATGRVLVDVRTVPAPYRKHMPHIIASGAQVFTESSRACSWAVCSFCLRGLTDVDGNSREYRRFTNHRLLDDFERLRDLGVTAITFADEDFLGGDLDDIEQFANSLAKVVHAVAPHRFAFDASMTIQSVYRKNDTESERSRREEVLRRLVSIGLRKVFLGIESGSASQLRRYKKGHTPDQCVTASKLVLGSGAKLELGFIMFDPLCSRAEIVENVRFLLDNDLAQYASSPTAELRMQIGSGYLQEIQKAEAKLGVELYDRELDPDTLSYPYRFADQDIAGLAESVRRDNARRQPLVYRLKGLTRFGDGRILGASTAVVRTLLGRYRTQTLEALAHAALTSPTKYEVEAQKALRDLAASILHVDGAVEHLIFRQAIEISRELLETY